MKRISSILTSILFAFTTLLVGFRLAGLKLFTVMSSSMEPELKTGSLVYIRPISPESLKTGDVISYVSNEENIITHRIFRAFETDDGLFFETKGDNNASPDSELVSSENVIGRVSFSLPFLGFIAVFLKSSLGLSLAIFLISFLFLNVLFSELNSKPNRKNLISLNKLKKGIK